MQQQLFQEEPPVTDQPPLPEEDAQQDQVLEEPTQSVQLRAPQLPSAEDLEVYRIVFELFDRGQTGHIQHHEMRSIMLKQGFDYAQCKLRSTCCDWN